MGKRFTVKPDFVAVRYSLANPKHYKGGDIVTLTDAEHAALPPALTRTLVAAATTVADPSYPAYPFGLGFH